MKTRKGPNKKRKGTRKIRKGGGITSYFFEDKVKKQIKCLENLIDKIVEFVLELIANNEYIEILKSFPDNPENNKLKYYVFHFVDFFKTYDTNRLSNIKNSVMTNNNIEKRNNLLNNLKQILLHVEISEGHLIKLIDKRI